MLLMAFRCCLSRHFGSLRGGFLLGEFINTAAVLVIFAA
jgi:hypothetical protein